MTHPSDFWRNSGYFLLERDPAGHLHPTPDFLRAYLRRPELAPVEESCDPERALHAALMAEPNRPVTTGEIDELADEDARHNYRMILRFRDDLRDAGTLEAWYHRLFSQSRQIEIPPLFIDHVVHAILRSLLNEDGDAMVARAGECLFREQVVTNLDGAILLADAETVDLRRQRQESGLVSLLDMAQSDDAANDLVQIDVLSEDNAAGYWERSDEFDMALDITFPRPGLDALCRVLERWIEHFLGAEVEIQPTQEITDERWVWHVGLDTEATALLNDLYNGRAVDEERNARLLSLFRLTFRDPAQMRADIANRPVYLALSQTPSGRLRMKPQNLLVGLPLASPT